MYRIGANVFGAAAILLGAVELVFGQFATYWHPVPDDIPALALLAYAGGLVFVAGGLAVQWPRTRAAGAAALVLLYLPFIALWVRRVLGFPGIFGTWLGTAEELATALGAAILFATALGRTREPAPAVRLAFRLAFGACAIVFGAAHFAYPQATAAIVPEWLPPHQLFWAYLTGACDVAAGLALLSGVLALLAARLLTLMFLVFQLLVWLPRIFAQPGDHIAWAGNGVNLALVGAAWIVADLLARAPPVGRTE
jgi:uncharacterized membrane protein